MYPVKLAFEDVLLLFVSPSYRVKSAFSVKYTERRFSEAKRLLADRHSVVGLSYLEKQVRETKTVIAQSKASATQKEVA